MFTDQEAHNFASQIFTAVSMKNYIKSYLGHSFLDGLNFFRSIVEAVKMSLSQWEPDSVTD